MKKLLLALALALVGCGPAPAPAINAAGQPMNRGDGDEVCYQGVVYVHFSAAQNSWGGVKMQASGLPETCKVL